MTPNPIFSFQKLDDLVWKMFFDECERASVVYHLIKDSEEKEAKIEEFALTVLYYRAMDILPNTRQNWEIVFGGQGLE